MDIRFHNAEAWQALTELPDDLKPLVARDMAIQAIRKCEGGLMLVQGSKRCLDFKYWYVACVAKRAYFNVRLKSSKMPRDLFRFVIADSTNAMEATSFYYSPVKQGTLSFNSASGSSRIGYSCKEIGQLIFLCGTIPDYRAQLLNGKDEKDEKNTLAINLLADFANHHNYF